MPIDGIALCIRGAHVDEQCDDGPEQEDDNRGKEAREHRSEHGDDRRDIEPVAEVELHRGALVWTPRWRRVRAPPRRAQRRAGFRSTRTSASIAPRRPHRREALGVKRSITGTLSAVAARIVGPPHGSMFPTPAAMATTQGRMRRSIRAGHRRGPARGRRSGRSRPQSHRDARSW